MVFWVAFDMDSTLGYFNSLTNYLLCLYPEDLRNMEPDLEIDFAIKDEWKPKIDAAFKEFTKLLAESEQINKMLRPGILQIIELLLKAKSEGKVGGLMIYSGDMFKAWKSSAFIGGLGAKALVRVQLDGEKATKADQWDMGARIREVEQGPDGAIWLLEDERAGSQGRLLKLTPKK